MGSDPKRWASRPGAASLQAHDEECGGSRSITELPPNGEQSANFEAGAMMWGIRNSAKARVGHVSDAFHAARSRDDRAREQIDATQYSIVSEEKREMILPPGHASLTNPSCLSSDPGRCTTAWLPTMT